MSVSKTFVGQPCKYGHVMRYMKGNRCVECNRAVNRRFRELKPSYWVSHRKIEVNAEKNRASTRRYLKNNPHINREFSAAYRAGLKTATPSWCDRDAIRLFYKNCPDGMEVDHIVPIRGENVCGLHVHWNLQYLTKSENSSKRNRFSYSPDIV